MNEATTQLQGFVTGTMWEREDHCRDSMFLLWEQGVSRIASATVSQSQIAELSSVNFLTLS